MQKDILGFENNKDKISKLAKISDSIIQLELGFDGINQDITEVYFWHLNFPYYTGKGYTTLKLEDHQYFSESSQFGQNFRQVKGGSIRAFQENLQQLVQILKVHLIPLLKEIKESDFYKSWFDKITDNDNLIFTEKKKSKSDFEKIKKWKKERDEAILHIKDKWVNETDGGNLWRVQKSSQEQGLDFTLTPTLFFGINLPDPFEKIETLKEQLDKYIYSVTISREARNMVAKFAYRFYTWLPTAIRDIQTTYNLKISAAKQFYMQMQMYINFMKPLLIEISKKTESFNIENLYADFETENPNIINLFDCSYSYIKTIGIRKFERDGYKISDLEFLEFGFFIPKNANFLKKEGYIISEDKSNYDFIECKKDISKSEFMKLEPIKISKDKLKKFSIMEFNFTQKRRNQNVQTPQGNQMNPYNINRIQYNGYIWNLFEIASYRKKLKVNDLELLESFITELKFVKKDIEKYIINVKSKNIPSSEIEKSNQEKKDYPLLLGPFKGFYELFSPIVAFSINKQKKVTSKKNDFRDDKIQIITDIWKVYTVNKKAHRYMQY